MNRWLKTLKASWAKRSPRFTPAKMGWSTSSARPDVDVVVAAVVGGLELPAALAAVKAGKTLALANKESLVVAGSLLIPEARKRGTAIIPVDSEHSAIFQALQCGRAKEVRLDHPHRQRRGRSAMPLEQNSQRHARRCPRTIQPGSMGNKVTIDSATMFNKGIGAHRRACWLFDLKPDQVQIMVHPESVIHSMVEFVDGSVIRRYLPPDMRTPIRYALTYPDRAGGCSRRMDWEKAFSLNFQPPDFARFPSLPLALRLPRRVERWGRC